MVEYVMYVGMWWDDLLQNLMLSDIWFSSSSSCVLCTMRGFFLVLWRLSGVENLRNWDGNWGEYFSMRCSDETTNRNKNKASHIISERVAHSDDDKTISWENNLSDIFQLYSKCHIINIIIHISQNLLHLRIFFYFSFPILFHDHSPYHRYPDCCWRVKTLTLECLLG